MKLNGERVRLKSAEADNLNIRFSEPRSDKSELKEKYTVAFHKLCLTTAASAESNSRKLKQISSTFQWPSQLCLPALGLSISEMKQANGRW